MHLPAPDRLSNVKLDALGITESFGAWIVECLLLPSLGMSEGSHTLVFDGNSIPEKTTAAFEVVQRDAVWQAALDICYTRGLLPQSTELERQFQKGYFYDILPQAIQNISQTSSLIRCNFDPGLPHSAEALVNAQRGWSLEQWKEGWKTYEPRFLETESPLPPWHVLRGQRVHPSI